MTAPAPSWRRRASALGIAGLLVVLGIWTTLRACAGPDGVIGIGPDEVEGHEFSNFIAEPVILFAVNPKTGEEVEFLRLEPNEGEYEQPPYDGGVECTRITIRARRGDGALAAEFEPGDCEPFKVTGSD